MTWVMYEFYHLKVTKRLYSCICAKSKAQPTVPTVLPKITLEGCIYEALDIIGSIIDKCFIQESFSSYVQEETLPDYAASGDD